MNGKVQYGTQLLLLGNLVAIKYFYSMQEAKSWGDSYRSVSGYQVVIGERIPKIIFEKQNKLTRLILCE